MSVSLLYLNGEEHKISLELDEPIWHFKQRIQPGSYTLIYNGQSLSDSKNLSYYNIQDGSKLHLIFGLHGGGNDGGSIPTRGEMVKFKRNSKRSDSAISKRKKWITCAVSKQPLCQPIVTDALGNIFNKEAIISSLIEKNMPERFSHIRSLRDLYDVNFKFNAKYDPTKPVKVGVEAEDLESPFECPMTAQPANGQHPFSLLTCCGHVFSDKGLKKAFESVNPTCFVCQKVFTKADVLPLNPDRETLEKLKQKLQPQQPNEKKKDKKQSQQTDTQPQPQSQQSEPLPQPQPKRKTGPSTKDSKSKRQKNSNGSNSNNNSNNIGSVRNTLAVQAALEKVNSNHDAKKRMSEAYKSIFSSPAANTSSPAFFTGTSRGVIK